jgi:hypothetical protein
MSERLLREFRERAEFLVPMPDLHELQREGTQRRRVRIAAGAALVASVLALGGTVVATTIDDENAIGPAHIGPTPPPSGEDCGLVAGGTAYESVPSGCELHAQVDEWRYVEEGHYFVRPFNTDLRLARPGDLEAWFEIPGDYWYWWGGGVGKASHPGGGPEMAPYIRVAITPITGVHGRRCQGGEPAPVQALPSSPLAIAHRLVVPPGIDVLETPRSVQKFGYDAAYVRFTVTQQCPSDQAFVLWRAFEPEDDILIGDDIDFGRTDADIYIEPQRTEHVFDVWVVDVQGEHLVVSADYTPDLGKIIYQEEDLARLQELLDSIRFEFTE